MMGCPTRKVAAAPTARNTPNGTKRFFPRSDSGTKMIVPSSAPRKMVSNTPSQPRKAPTIAIILMSPPPMASSLKILVPAAPTAHSTPKPTTAPIRAHSTA
jgi:hypothetical protein